MILPFSAARYPEENQKTYHLRRWTENLLFKFLEKPVMFYNSRYKKDFRGKWIPYRKKDHDIA